MEAAPKTLLGRQATRQLKSGKKTKEQLLEWLHRNEDRMQPDELKEVRNLLKVDQRLDEIAFRDLVPDGWLADLMNVQKESESPAPFFFLAGLVTFSNMVGRKVMIDRGNHRLGLDVSAMLISPAGRGRRSTACDFVVYDVGVPAGLPVLADSFTYEAFGDELIECSTKKPTPTDRRAFGPKTLVYAGEMATLLGKNSYADSMIPKLTDILGKTTQFQWKTVKRGKVKFMNPMVNALLTSSPDWLADNIPHIVFGGGMLSRFLICVREMPEQVVTWGKALNKDAIKKLSARLKSLSDVTGVFGRPDGEAFEWYDQWYQAHAKRYLYGEIPDPKMAPYFSRKHDHLLRMTALLTLAAGSSKRMAFTVPRFEQALKILEYLELDMPKAYAQMALSPIAAAQRSVYDAIERHGGQIPRWLLQKKVYRALPLKEQFDAVMRSLQEMGVVKEIPNLTGRGKSYLLQGTLD